MRQKTARLLLIMVLAGAAAPLRAQTDGNVPVSYGAAGKVDTPILRVPFLATRPKIDGVMAPGEWDDASALSGFKYDADNGIFINLAPEQTQLQVYAGYDRENLYFCYSSPVYPVDSWMKARGRFPDVLMHPLYGMLWDDHTELELRPVLDLVKGEELGMLRWDVNPIGTFNDWHYGRDGGQDFRWNSGAIIRTQADGRRWVIEYAIPLKSLRYGSYDGKDENDRPLVPIPPPDGTAYRAWFSRGIGGNGPFFNNFDGTDWLVTKTMLIFDSKAPVFQINEIGPIMDGILDMEMTVKNHNTRSETVRLGFHIENPEDTIYSSYQSKEIPDGVLELRPGETRKVRLRKELADMQANGNVLWFDVRSAGTPAKTMFLTRLIKFHSMDGGFGGRPPRSFRERRIDAIEKLRPPRVPFFDLRVNVSPYTKRLSALIDRGIVGVKEEIKTAVEARLIVRHMSGDEPTEVHEAAAPFIGNFATFLIDVPELMAGEKYEVNVLAFDENMKIVGEQTETKPFIALNAAMTSEAVVDRASRFNPLPFMAKDKSTDGQQVAMQFMPGMSTRSGVQNPRFQTAPWMNNGLGQDDVVWEPFTAIVANEKGFETLKHRFTLDGSGLPAQIDIRPDQRELPLEERGPQAGVSAETLMAIGRGPQLRAPLRLEAVINGKRVPAKVVAPAKVVRTWKSEIEYAATLRIGPLDAELLTRYDCDGSMHARLIYGCDAPAKIDRLELVADVAGTVDLMLSESCGMGGYVGADRGECALPAGPGVLWDSTMTKIELFYSRFVPWFWFGSADRGWSYFSDSDKGWMLNKDGSTMQIERNKAGDVTWRVMFVNHPVELKDRRTLSFSILTHPAKPKPENFRLYAWQYHEGYAWQDESDPFQTAMQGMGGEIQAALSRISVPYLIEDNMLIGLWHRAAGNIPTNVPYADAPRIRKDKPPFYRYNMAEGVAMDLPAKDQLYEDKAVHYFERLVRIGRRVGWWMDPYWPGMGSGVSQNSAMDGAYFRPTESIGTNELPIQAAFLTTHMRNVYKRLARIHQENNVPLRHHTRANNAARMLESFLWNSAMMKETGSDINDYDLDLITVFPNSLYRVMAMNYCGLMTTMVPGHSPAVSGDNPVFDRQRFGLALLHDFGVSRGGSHATAIPHLSGVPLDHQEQAVRLIDRLARFGFFEDAAIEKLPFWRNDAQVRMGDQPGEESKVRVTIYRRPLESGKGYKAIFVILNESDGDIRLPLNIRNPKRILGGPNTQRRRDVVGRTTLPNAIQEAWPAGNGKTADMPALMDIETGGVIARADGKGEKYGPVFVPYHDYRVLYGECVK